MDEDSGKHNHRREMGNVSELLKRELDTDTLYATGDGDSGCISDGRAFLTDRGMVFVKFNARPEAEEMFQAEYEGLVAVGATNTVAVPRPIKLIKNPGGGAMLVLEYLDIQPLTDFATLGNQVAKLHLYNENLRKRASKNENNITSDHNLDYVDQFGFHVTNHCGYFPQPNGWMDNWTDFYARKMENHLTLIEQRHGDRDARPLWSSLLPKLPKLFSSIDVKPALLHGDLWRGNIGQTPYGPVTFDPITLYGHTEFEISIARVHEGFDQSYFDSYHNIIPIETGYQDRLDLYLLHHYFQLWNHFGENYVENALKEVEPETHRARFKDGYKTSTLNLLRRLDNKLS